MLYPSTLEIKIGFDEIRNLVKKECLSEKGKKSVDKITFSSDSKLIEKLVSQTDEMSKMLRTTDVLPADGFPDIDYHLEMSKIEGIALDENAFRDIKTVINSLMLCLRSMGSMDKVQIPYLCALSEQISFDKELAKKIDRVIDENGKIRDNASPKLAQIRYELVSEQSTLRRKLDQTLKMCKSEGYSPEDTSLTIRNGRMVIPVLAENKKKIKGLIHDESSTGQTVFIEPLDVFDANNHIKELQIEERQEIKNILTILTDEIRKNKEDLERSCRFLTIIDLIRAKAKFGSKINAGKQLMANEPTINWTAVVHPLLYLSHMAQQKPIIPLSLHLEAPKRALVVSGPNAGGKSIVAKTVALLQYMHQCGFMVPNGEQCQFGIFKDIFIDIGDSQSIENDLSTYSSHLTAMREVIKHAGMHSLVVLDEFGTGTDPQYGGAIAESILEELIKLKSTAIINTHYSNLKYFAENTDGAVNGAMNFDHENLSPLYTLEVGKPGNSFALEIAEKIGLPTNVINRARNKIGEKKINVDKLVKELQMEKEHFRLKNDELEKSKENLETTVNQYSELKDFLEKTKNETLQFSRNEAKRLIKETKLQCQTYLKELKESQGTKQEKTIKANLELAGMEEKIDVVTNHKPISKPKGDIKIKNGDNVQVNGQDGTFKVIKIGEKEAELSLGQLIVKVNPERLIKSSGDKQIELSHPMHKYGRGIDIHSRLANFKPSIDLRGKRGDEAISMIDTLLDDALLVGGNDLKILHGKGDGILRKLIREHLKRQHFVQSFQDEKMEFGGDGITLVKLK